MVSVRVRPGPSLEAPENWPLAFLSVGFEARSSFLGLGYLRGVDRRVAFPFGWHHELDFHRNLELLRADGCEIVDEGTDFRTCVRMHLEALGPHGSVAVDISSMTRTRMAVMWGELARAAPVCATFLYAPAAFRSPQIEVGPIDPPHPVAEEFVGWSERPNEPVAAVFGLGYEPERGLGALDVIEPGEAWAFIPTGTDLRFDESLREANSLLIRTIGEDRIVPYPVLDPFEAYLRLDSFSYVGHQFGRLLFVPMGPKIFTVVSMAVASRYDPWLPIWRVSAGKREVPRQAEPSGLLSSLTVVFAAE